MDKLKTWWADWRGRRHYVELQRKVFFQMTLLAIASALFLLFLYTQIPYGWISTVSVAVLQRLFGMGYWGAVELYDRVIRENFHFIMAASVFVVFFFFLRYALGWFLRYFAQIERGLDDLLAEGEHPITLSPDLHLLEQKFNTVHQTLERRRLESQLAEQRKNDLVMYLAHDIRTPLTSVIGYLSLLEEAPDMSCEQRARYTGIALQKAQRLEHLVNEFFEITRYNLQEILLEQQRFDLHYLLVQLTDEFYPTLSAHGNTLRLQAAEGLTVYGDADKLARVFNNLLKNAVAYSYPDSEITVCAVAVENTVMVEVRNYGRTIPPQRLDAIFERFFRLDDARGSDSGGAGLGLAIAKEIVTRHGGIITATSANEVTTFTVALPDPQANLSLPLGKS